MRQHPLRGIAKPEYQKPFPPTDDYIHLAIATQPKPDYLAMLKTVPLP
ncbi:hypothetical protein IQ238_16100 [Pleurocapsales cyanobacterium LEGE 06147]|nr:hypothetical protein [Pleurocapsales cyanobacterium LEGE 06147]